MLKGRNILKAKSKIGGYIARSTAAAAMLMLSAQTSLAASATWLFSPMDGGWENPCNWTGGSMACGYFSAAEPPNGPSDTAGFDRSDTTAASISASTTVDGIVFSES